MRHVGEKIMRFRGLSTVTCVTGQRDLQAGQAVGRGQPRPVACMRARRHAIGGSRERYGYRVEGSAWRAERGQVNTSTCRTTLSLGEAIVVATICFGLFILASVQAVFAGFPEARYSDADNVWGIFIELVLGALALIYLRLRDFDLAALYPRPELRGTVIGIALYIVAWIAGDLAVMPLQAADNTLPVVEFSYAGSSLVPIVLFAMVNGTFEEVFLLGVLARGLQDRGPAFAAGVSLLVRLSYHLYQGPAGAIWVLVFGLVVTVYYLRTRRLWPVVFAHILGDIVPFVLPPG